ncbi:MAG: class B sortase [Faecalimonas sp.]|nr:class B sortase [Faecalimonas sp.]
MEEKEKKNAKWKKVLFILSLLLLLLGLGYLVFYFVTREKNHDIYEEIQPQKPVEKPVTEEPVEEEPVVIPIDFVSLKAQNADIYAWIQIPDTNVDYPIVQHPTDDSYYLDHTIEHVKGYPGSIYTESVSKKDFTDFNTLIYGHDMKNGTMFKHLHKFENADFFNSHDTVTIYTETEIKTYRIYAALVYDNRHIVYSYDQSTVEGRQAFIQSLHNQTSWKNHFREGMTIDENSKLITLSTCIAGQPDKRYIVVAAEVDS